MAFYEYGEVDDDTRDAILEDREADRRKAREDVFSAAYRCGIASDEDDELTEALCVAVAYRLAEGAKQRKGAWPDPSTAHLQRCWDALVCLDDEASRIDNAALDDVFAEALP